jgi:hypothetical protein
MRIKVYLRLRVSVEKPKGATSRQQQLLQLDVAPKLSRAFLEEIGGIDRSLLWSRREVRQRALLAI